MPKMPFNMTSSDLTVTIITDCVVISWRDGRAGSFIPPAELVRSVKPNKQAITRENSRVNEE